jgi:pimeloyl-ACP methyl ester carboxylesterase
VARADVSGPPNFRDGADARIGIENVSEVTVKETSTPTEEYLEFSGGRVHLLHAGEGEPLLFLHAAGGAGRWNEFLELLAGRFEVFAPDHPGFGGSDELPGIEDIDDLVYHYLDVIERLGLDSPHVVGGSFGGWIGAELAVLAPYAIHSLVLLGAAGLRLPEHPVADLFLMTPPQLVQTLFRDPAKASSVFPAEPDVDAVLTAYRDATALARFSWVPFMCDPKLERRLHRISVPTMVAWAAEDRLIPVAHGHRYADRIPNASFSLVGDCGHAMYFERPAEFARITTEFLAKDTSLSGGHR